MYERVEATLSDSSDINDFEDKIAKAKGLAFNWVNAPSPYTGSLQIFPTLTRSFFSNK